MLLRKDGHVARNKLRFKKRCMQYGLKVPKYFQLEEPFNKKKLSEIIYPVIVKPTDSCAQQGLSLCWNEKELSIGYHRAMEKSPSKQVLIEEYIFGNEIDIFYFIDNGKPLLISMNDKYFMLINNRRNASFQPSPSQFYGEYSEKLSFNVKKLFEGLNCKQGNIFLQAIYKDGEFYFLEMGYRIDGIGTWVNTKSQIGFSNVELMVDLALGRKLSVNIEKEIDLRPELQNNAIYLLWAKPGKVGQVIGLDEIKNMEGVNIILERFHKGDFILKTDSMLQIAYYIGITGKNQQDVLDKLKIINEKLHLYSVEGKELLTPFLNYNVLQKRCNR